MSIFRITGATLRAARLVTGALLVTASLAASAQSSVVYDSLTGAQRYYSQCFVCSDAPDVLELGDIITLAGTERSIKTITLGIEQDVTLSTTPYQLSLTLSLYSVDGELRTSEIASRTVGLEITASGTYNVPISFQGVIVPDTIYYGLSATSASPQLAGLRLSLWDYYDQSLNGDGQSVPVGTDVGTQVLGLDLIATQVYVRLSSDPASLRAVGADGWGADLAGGFTPALQIIAAPVPEPQTLALFLVGGLAMVLIGRRRGER